MTLRTTLQRAALGVAATAVFGTALAAPAFAAPTSVDQEIIGGSLTASIANAEMTDINYSHAQGLTTGTLTLGVSDLRGSSAGWSVTVASSDFDYLGTSPTGIDIPNTGFSIATARDPVKTAGQAIDPTNGPYKINGGALNTARTTIGAKTGYGSGDYTQQLDVELVIPALSQTGLYRATLTVATAAAP